MACLPSPPWASMRLRRIASNSLRIVSWRLTVPMAEQTRQRNCGGLFDHFRSMPESGKRRPGVGTNSDFKSRESFQAQLAHECVKPRVGAERIQERIDLERMNPLVVVVR